MIGNNGNDLFQDLVPEDAPGAPGDTVLAGSGDDTIVGSAADDSLFGEDGNDSIGGGGGDDLIDGGDGNDTAMGDDGDDTVNGGFGLDSLFGNDGSDVFLNADGEADSVDGGDGINEAQDEAAQTDTFANIDDFFDLLDMTLAAPIPAAGPAPAPPVTTPVVTLSAGGTLSVVATDSADTIDLSAVAGGGISVTIKGKYQKTFAGVRRIAVSGLDGNDTVSLNNVTLPATIGGDAGDDSLTGGAGPDSILGGDGNDTLRGADGTDILDGGAGADLISGGRGASDRVTYASRRLSVAVSLDGVANDGQKNEGDNVLADVEDIFGGRGNDILVGSSSRNLLAGGLGSDTLIGNTNTTPATGDNFDAAPSSGVDAPDKIYGTPGNDFFKMRDGGDDYYFKGGGKLDQAGDRDPSDIAVASSQELDAIVF
jgi:Ca2+-binding RTX toxin-like protein